MCALRQKSSFSLSDGIRRLNKISTRVMHMRASAHTSLSHVPNNYTRTKIASACVCKQACMMRAHTLSHYANIPLGDAFFQQLWCRSSQEGGREGERLNILLCIAFTCVRGFYICTTSTFRGDYAHRCC